MFVRFRKVSNGGFAPRTAKTKAAARLCRRRELDIYGPCKGRCKAKPRCRWAIGEGRCLEPYRLKVMLVENVRVNGRVKQETVATLGSIDATWLDGFWAAVGEDELTRLRIPDWRLRSLRVRTAFWKDVLERMEKIGDNRLSQDDRKAIRRAIHKMVPWVMEGERRELDLLEAESDLAAWHRTRADWADLIVTMEREIADLESRIEKKREVVTDARPIVEHVDANIRSRQLAIAQGKIKVDPEQVRRRVEADRALGQVRWCGARVTLEHKGDK
jgi:hypothetical protein